jgi:uncharacterized caspase-like protein
MLRRVSSLNSLCVAVVYCGIAAVFTSHSEASNPPDSRLVTPSPVPRIALVIGAQFYQDRDRMPEAINALSDARAVASVLAGASFSVTLVEDPDRKRLVSEIRSFSDRLAAIEGPAVAAFFFAGHGFQTEGFNYIVPIDAVSRDLPISSVPVTHLIDTFGRRPAGIAVMFLDACRSDLVDVADRSADAARRGFHAPEYPERAFLGFATEFGDVAKGFVRSEDKNSPFTSALTELLPAPGVPIEKLFKNVRLFVERKTSRDQSPRELTSLVGDFYFHPTEQQREMERGLWLQALASERPDEIRSYAENYPDSAFASAALLWLKINSADEERSP